MIFRVSVNLLEGIILCYHQIYALRAAFRDPAATSTSLLRPGVQVGAYSELNFGRRSRPYHLSVSEN